MIVPVKPVECASTNEGQAFLSRGTFSVALLAAAAVWAPLAFGASGTWTRLALELSMATAAFAWAITNRRPFWLTAFPLVISGSMLVQLAPFPEWFLLKIAPVSAGAWKVAFADSPGSRACVSVDPAATMSGIRTMLLALTATAAITDIARLQTHRRFLLAAVAVSGVLILGVGSVCGQIGEDYRMLGLIDISGPILRTQSPIILPSQSNGVGIAEWVEIGDQRYPSDSGWIGGCVGTFFYGNHFAAAICLTLPVVLSYWLRLATSRMPAWLCWLGVGGLAAAGIWSVTCVAQSRAGTGALVLTLLTFCSMAAPFRWMRLVAGVAAAMTAVAVAAFLFIVLLPGDTVLDFVPADYKQQAAKLLADGRAGPARVAIRAFLASPFMGTGLDTFRYIFPRFYKDRYALFYAHNDFAQFLAETGLLGLAWLAAFAWYLTPKAVRFWRDAPGDYRALNAGPWAALAGITAHAAFDWDLHLPANALLTVILVGLAASSVPSRKPERVGTPWIAESVPRFMLAACCLLALVGLIRDAASEMAQRRLREAIVADRLALKDQQRPPADSLLAAAIFSGEQMARWAPRDARLLVALGQANLHLARLATADADRSLVLAASQAWFQRARHASAMCRGLAEPAVKTNDQRR